MDKRAPDPPGKPQEIAGLPDDAVATDGARRGGRRSGVTLQQLRIFFAVARSDTLTRAAKNLGLAQPSLSQQISRLEETVGTRLFERRSSQMSLTEAGQYLMREVEPILVRMRDLEDGLSAFGAGRRQTVRIAGLNSILRVVLPTALRRLAAAFPDLELDVHEHAPAEVLDLLYERRVNIGLLAANSIATHSVGFHQVPVIEDPYVLAVPAALDLADVQDARKQLPPEQLAVLNSTIQFVFGTQHGTRVQTWFRQMLPDHRLALQCRTFEVAMGMVQAGMGISLVPALSAVVGGGVVDGIRLYRVNAEPRRIVALVPSQFRRVEPYATLLRELQQAGSEYVLPRLLPTPPFLDRGAAASL